MGLLKRYVRQRTVVEYHCSPMAEGWCAICFGIVFILIWGVFCMVNGPGEPWAMWLSFAFIATPLAFGVYLLKLRRKPLKREVTLGGWYNRLWLRNKWLFVAAGLAVYCVGATVGWFIVVLVFDGYDALFDKLEHKLHGWWLLLLMFSCCVMRDYLGFHQYYRSAEYRRSLDSGDGDGRPS